MEGSIKVGDVVEVKLLDRRWERGTVKRLIWGATHLGGAVVRLDSGDMISVMAHEVVPYVPTLPSKADPEASTEPTACEQAAGDCAVCEGPCTGMPKASRNAIPPPAPRAEIAACPPGTKYDGAKPDWALAQWRALESYVDVLTFGARKYAPDNWRKVPNADRRYMAAAFRHMAAHMQGEINDPESGKPHLAHAMCCLAFVLEMQLEGEGA